MLQLLELAPSPNNTKVRMALRYKGVPFETLAIDPFDRAVVLEATGQELTPAIRDRGIVLNDSEAILQYLDANYPGTPRLFPRLRAGRQACDAWKARLDAEIVPHWRPALMYVLKLSESFENESRERYQQALRVLDVQIGDRDSFHDDPEMAVCDLRVAEWATYLFPGSGLVTRVPLFAKFESVLSPGLAPEALPNLRRFLRPWQERLA